MKNLRNKNHPPNQDIVQQYLQSSWDVVLAVYNALPLLIQLGEAVDDGDLDDFLSQTDIDTIAKLNAILTDADLGDFASEAEAIAGVNNTKTMTPLRVAQAVAILAAGIKNEFEGIGPPDANQDSGEGFSAGSVWIDTVANPKETYRCVDPTPGAAVWVLTSLTADELAVVALSGNSDDLLEGVTKLLMTVAERSKLSNIEPNATADQSNAEIEAAYNAQVPAVNQATAEAGTSTTIHRWTPERVKQAIQALASGGIAWSNANSNTAVAADTGTVFYGLSASVTATLPASPVVGDSLIIINNDGTPGFPWNVIIAAGGSNEIHIKNVTVISSYSLIAGEQAVLVCYDAGATKKWHLARTTSNVTGLSGTYTDVDADALPGKMYFVDSLIGAITLTFPANPPLDTYIHVSDVGYNAGTNNITINRNGKTINGVASNFIIDVDGGHADFVFDSIADTWRIAPVIPSYPAPMEAIVLDSEFEIQDEADTTRKIAFSAGGISSGQTRLITMPDRNVDLGKVQIQTFVFAASDELTSITTGVAKLTFRMPYNFTLTEVPRASVNTAPVGSTVIIDINEAGVSILSTKLSIDVSEKTSMTAAVPAVLSDTFLAEDAEITIDFDQVGSTTPGKGVKVMLIGYKS